MPTKQPDIQLADQPKREPQQLSAKIGKQVIHTLGRPGESHRVQVRPLWGDHYRVNVLVGDPASARIAHSYFLVADSEGNVVTCIPSITRHY